jgi:hypothetical protein
VGSIGGGSASAIGGASLLVVGGRAADLTGAARVETDIGRGHLPDAQEEQVAEEGPGDDVEDTVEGGLGVRVDDVAAFAEAPGDWVEEADEDREPDAQVVGPVDGGAEGAGEDTAGEEEKVDEVGEGEEAEDRKAPLVGRGDQGTGQGGDDGDLAQEDGEEDRGPGRGSEQEEVQEDERGGDEPEAPSAGATRPDRGSPHQSM